MFPLSAFRFLTKSHVQTLRSHHHFRFLINSPLYQLSVHIVTSASPRIPLCINSPFTSSFPFPSQNPTYQLSVHTFTSASSQNPTYQLPVHIIISVFLTNSHVPTFRSHLHFRFLINSPLYQLSVHTFTSVSLTKSHVPTFRSHLHFRFPHKIPRTNSPFTQSFPFPHKIPRTNSPFTHSLTFPQNHCILYVFMNKKKPPLFAGLWIVLVWIAYDECVAW